MEVRLCDLQHKEIVNLTNGAVLGFADDILLQTETAEVVSLIVCGRPRMFGLLGRQNDLVIPWSCIRTVGEDTILVAMDSSPEQCPPLRRSFRKSWKEFWT